MDVVPICGWMSLEVICSTDLRFQSHKNSFLLKYKFHVDSRTLNEDVLPFAVMFRQVTVTPDLKATGVTPRFIEEFIADGNHAWKCSFSKCCC